MFTWRKPNDPARYFRIQFNISNVLYNLVGKPTFSFMLIIAGVNVAFVNCDRFLGLLRSRFPLGILQSGLVVFQPSFIGVNYLCVVTTTNPLPTDKPMCANRRKFRWSNFQLEVYLYS